MLTPDEIMAESAARKEDERAAERKAREEHERSLEGKVREIDPQRLIAVSDPERFTCTDVWENFHALTIDWPPHDRVVTWLNLVELTGCGKDQYRFTEGDWRRLYARFTGRVGVLEQPRLALTTNN